jgi:dTDP-L-rhamnose 4-epimerase
VVDLLVEKGYDTRILDNLDPQVHEQSSPPNINKKAEFVKGDVTKRNDWLKALDGVDKIIHLAGVVGINQSMYQPIRYLNTNSLGIAVLYETLLKVPTLKKKINKIIIASSKTIYGEGAYECCKHGLVFPGLRPIKQLNANDWEVHCTKCDEYLKPVGITEDKPPQNLSVYALSKYDLERLSLMYGEAMDIPTIALRYFSAYGPRQSLSNPYSGVCAIFISRILNKKPPIIFEDGEQLRDFIFVDDIARATLLALEKGKKSDCYNVGSGKSTSLNQLLEMLKKILDNSIETEFRNDFRIGDTRSDFADISKIDNELGFRPTASLEDGLEKLIQWSADKTAIDRLEKSLVKSNVFRRVE